MALENFSGHKDDAMQVSGSYTAIGSIFEIRSSQRTLRPFARSAWATGDTVSISEEALAAYRNTCRQGEVAPDEEALETGAKFRKALEEAWNRSEETSLSGRFLSAISSWRNRPSDASALPERVRGQEDTASEPPMQRESGARTSP